MNLDLLKGVRVVESSAFIAEPRAGVTMAQFGADVIRIDLIGGGIDHARMPVMPGGVLLTNFGTPWLSHAALVEQQPDLVSCTIEGNADGRRVYLAAGAAVRELRHERGPTQPAPPLGQHTDEVLMDVLRLDAATVGALHDRGVVAGAAT